MGKKSKQKKQRQQAQRQQMSQVQITPRQVVTPSSAMPMQAAPTRATGLEIGEQYIRTDIIRILVFLGVIALILIGLLVASERSSFVINTGQKLSHFLRLQ